MSRGLSQHRSLDTTQRLSLNTLMAVVSVIVSLSVSAPVKDVDVVASSGVE